MGVAIVALSGSGFGAIIAQAPLAARAVACLTGIKAALCEAG
jgi:hypothetical protein